MDEKPKRFRRASRYPKFGVLSDTPLSAVITQPRPYASIAATTPRLKPMTFHYEKEIDPIRLKTGGLIQPSLLKNSVAEKIEMDITPKTAYILGTYDYPVKVGREHPRTTVGLVIRDIDSPKVSHLESYYPGRGLRREMIYDLAKKQGSILIHTPTPEPYEKMGGEYLTESRSGKIPMRITREGFEAAHLSEEKPEEEGPLNPSELPKRNLQPSDVPREIGWEYRRTERPQGYLKYMTQPTVHSSPHIVKKRLPAEVTEGYVPPSEKEIEALEYAREKPYQYKLQSPLIPKHGGYPVEQEYEIREGAVMPRERPKEIGVGFSTLPDQPTRADSEPSEDMFMTKEGRKEARKYAGSEEQIDEEIESLFGKD